MVAGLLYEKGYVYASFNWIWKGRRYKINAFAFYLPRKPSIIFRDYT